MCVWLSAQPVSRRRFILGQVSMPEASINQNTVRQSVAVGSVGAAEVHCCWRSNCSRLVSGSGGSWVAPHATRVDGLGFSLGVKL